MKRISVNMVKKAEEGTLDKEVVYNIGREWVKEIIKTISSDKKSKKAEFMLDQFFAALLVDGISDTERIDIIRQIVDDVAKTFATPKAWEMIKDEIKDDLNKNFKVS